MSIEMSGKRKLDAEALSQQQQQLRTKRVMFAEECDDDTGISSLEEDSSDTDDDFFLTYSIFGDNGDDEEEDFASRMEFLNSKQAILSRVSEVLTRDEAYSASVAATTAKQTKFPSSALLKEARSILWTLGLRTHSTEPVLKPKLPYGTKQHKSPKHPSIDFSRCLRVPSEKYQLHCQKESKSGSNDTLLNLPTSIFCEGQWMAQALVWSAPSCAPRNFQPQVHNGDDFRWKVVSNPMTQSLGLLPPTGVSMENAVDLPEAVSISNEARVVSQSTPPFCIVYVNRAFLEFTGAQNKESIIGRPVESILHVPTPSVVSTEPALADDTTTVHETKKYLRGNLAIRPNAPRCRLSVTPVVDLDRRQTAAKRIDFQCMSHILLQVFPEE